MAEKLFNDLQIFGPNISAQTLRMLKRCSKVTQNSPQSIKKKFRNVKILDCVVAAADDDDDDDDPREKRRIWFKIDFSLHPHSNLGILLSRVGIFQRNAVRPTTTRFKLSFCRASSKINKLWRTVCTIVGVSCNAREWNRTLNNDIFQCEKQKKRKKG